MSATAWRTPSWRGTATRSPRPTWIISVKPGKDREAPRAVGAAVAAAIDEDGSAEPHFGPDRRGHGAAAGACHQRGRVAGRSGRSLLQQVQWRRDGYHRRVRVGAPENHRQI